MQKAALGQSEGSEGERKRARWRGQEEDEQRQKRRDGRTKHYERRRSVALGGLGAHPCASAAVQPSRHAAGLKRWQRCAITGTVRALPDAARDAMRAFMRPALCHPLRA
jgi:hypothetical protein